LLGRHWGGGEAQGKSPNLPSLKPAAPAKTVRECPVTVMIADGCARQTLDRMQAELDRCLGA